MTLPRISAVITSRNRRDELRRALLSCCAQTEVAFDVFIFDDASDDDTDQMIQNEFGDFRLFRSLVRTGYIVLRNRGFHEARGDFVLSLDDDAYFTQPVTRLRNDSQSIG